jgi:hypothetical protein
MKTYTAQEWQLKFKEQSGKDKQLLHDLECTALVKAEDCEAENKHVNRKLEYALGYTANLLMEHNVSGTFVKNYIEKFDDKDKWVNISYVKELFEILAKPYISVGGKPT